jgi:cell division protein ZapA
MSTVTLSIGPKSYSVACADGEEAHIRALGGIIAEKYAQLGSARAPLEAQNLLFAALFLADELADARKRAAEAPPPPPPVADPEELEALRATIAQLQSDLAAAHEAAAQPAPAPAPTLSPAPQPDLFGGPVLTPDLTDALAETLEALAARAEASAAALEAAAANA